jgi:hypothetical protein
MFAGVMAYDSREEPGMKRYAGIELHSNNSVVSLIDENDKAVAEERLPNELERSDAERASLARKALGVSRKVLLEPGTIVTPDTPLRWQRQLIAKTFDFSDQRRLGRPPIPRGVGNELATARTGQRTGAAASPAHAQGRRCLARARELPVGGAAGAHLRDFSSGISSTVSVSAYA